MGTSPLGVAIGLSGDAQTQPGHPTGHVPFTGSMHWVTLGPMFTLQQSWPGAQHWLPQQV